MIGSTRNVKVFARSEPTDMRKGFDGLFALVRDALGHDPLSGHMYLFIARNRRRLFMGSKNVVKLTRRPEWRRAM